MGEGPTEDADESGSFLKIHSEPATSETPRKRTASSAHLDGARKRLSQVSSSSPAARAGFQSPLKTRTTPTGVATPVKRSSAQSGSTSKPFRSPLARKSPSGSAAGTMSGKTTAGLSIQIAQLQTRALKMRQALQIVRADEASYDKQGTASLDIENSSKSLKRLTRKWQRAGQQAAELCFALSGSAGMTHEQVRAMFNASRTVWQNDEDDEQQVPSSEDFDTLEADEPTDHEKRIKAAAEEEKPSWHVGKMCLLMGINPEALGWNEDEEDWDGIKSDDG
ncbi:uncharacterized protein L969DRAFT_84293 [Mixia osmundae IAM 14324]|uniref:Uncharacterized protein n=1 Tax=Mixia osmundae (strain CBS 9802 / IAM 14324 / JCM 22182 / KY 12970) TaxID=764103 RepID=G7E395_MIXOS|nr:uncharacterized protein L969DRAFT_84293 [Mixia osmundae IAM 14324]KEI42435.1 hypothetical protein L969DRAFT_84293 [Mixia osmundae IAM 14324]GAA97276.1 hypothetical protein E5Q_03953 [Mixia osmundae IAM 14324]